MTGKGKVYFLDTTHPFLAEELKRQGYSVMPLYEGSYLQVCKAISDAVGLVIRSRIKVDRGLIDSAPALRFIARVGSGMENIDESWATTRGIICLNAPEGNRDSVGEHALGLLLAVMNHLVRGDREVKNGIWRREANRGREIGGKTVAIIGYGNTGSAFARKLSGLGVRVIAFDKYRAGYGDAFVEEVQMDEVFRETDILSFHVPLTDETRYLLNRSYIQSFVKPFWLINTSRGPVVETSALVEALEGGKILGAGLDVLEYEKSSLEGLSFEEFPDSFRALAHRDDVVLSPHVAGWTDESLFRLAVVLGEKIGGMDGELKVKS